MSATKVSSLFFTALFAAEKELPAASLALIAARDAAAERWLDAASEALRADPLAEAVMQLRVLGNEAARKERAVETAPPVAPARERIPTQHTDAEVCGLFEAAALPCRNDFAHAYRIYRGDVAKAGMQALAMEDWADVRSMERDQGALCDLEREYDSYRKERGEAGEVVLTLTQFLPVWRKYRRGQMPQEWIADAIAEAELAAGIRAQSVS